MSRSTIGRNVGLAAVAAFVAAEGPGTSLTTWSSGISAVEWATLLAAISLAVAFVIEGSRLIERWRRPAKAAREGPVDASSAPSQ